MPTGFVTSAACLAHETGRGHPERPERLAALLERVESSGLAAELSTEDAPRASRADLERVHPSAYVARVEQRIAAGADWVDSPDANVGPRSFDAALRAAGGSLLAVERVLAGAWTNAFVAVRPPGHHAEASLAMGFCLFNNVALAARALRERHGLSRVAIVDWDVHHGNGTQHLFEHDPSVFYASLHQYPHYPGTGAAGERGLGPGEGATLNCPMPAGSGDAEWLAAFEGRVLPALEDFRPEFVLVSAGFDAHAADPLSDTRLAAAAFGRMTESLAQLARAQGHERLVAVLEGGYDLGALSDSAEATLRALLAAS